MTESNFPLLLLEQNKHAINKKQVGVLPIPGRQPREAWKKGPNWSLKEILAVDRDDCNN